MARSTTDPDGSGPLLRSIILLASLAVALGGAASVSTPAEDVVVLQVPRVDIGELQLEPRRQQQLEAAEGYAPFHDFRFEDRLPESGITFRHAPTADGTVDYKMVHYDHGNGIGLADVDGDGRLDLYFVTQEGANQLWRNRGDGRFEDVTERAGLAMADVVSVAPTFADFDNDGDPDLFVTTVRMGNRLFRNDGELRFRDVTRKSGLGHVGHSSGAIALDWDNDGLLDLFVTNVGKYTGEERGASGYWIGYPDAFFGHLDPARSERSLLYRNRGGLRFEDVTERTGLIDEGWSGDASFSDLNGDDLPDLYVLNMQGDDHYWENVEGKRFVDKTAAYYPKTSWGAMGIAFFDFQNDGRADLLVTDMHSDMAFEFNPNAETNKSHMTWDDEHLQGGDNNIFGNSFYVNDGDPPFEELSDAVGAENFWPWGATVGDLNADGFPDVFIASSMNFPFRYGINSVLLNDAGKAFVAAEFVLGVEPRRDGAVRVPWFEMQCPREMPAWGPPLGGIESLYEACGYREGGVTVLGTLGSRTAAIFDLDADGDLDIVTGDFNSAPQVLISDLTERREIAWIEVELEGTRSNRDGLGARVRVVTPERTLHRYHDGKSGYLSQGSQPLYFGLGESTRIERIEVDWPSGTRQVVHENLAVGERISIRESDD